jgi:hypothetical protein
LYCLLSLLKADELGHVASAVAGKGKRTASEAMAAIEAHVTRCVEGVSGQAGLRKLADSVSQQMSRAAAANTSYFLALTPGAAPLPPHASRPQAAETWEFYRAETEKLVHRAFAVTFVASGYESEDVPLLLRCDLESQRFVGGLCATEADATEVETGEGVLRLRLERRDMR